MTNTIKEHIGFHYLLHMVVCFETFGIEYISEEVLSKIKDKSITLTMYLIITPNVFRIQDDDSIMCEFYCIVFIEYILAGKTLLDHSTLFSSNNYKKNDKIIYKYFKDKHDKRGCNLDLKNGQNKKQSFGRNKTIN